MSDGIDEQRLLYGIRVGSYQSVITEYNGCGRFSSMQAFWRVAEHVNANVVRNSDEYCVTYWMRSRPKAAAFNCPLNIAEAYLVAKNFKTRNIVEERNFARALFFRGCKKKKKNTNTSRSVRAVRVHDVR